MEYNYALYFCINKPPIGTLPTNISYFDKLLSVENVQDLINNTKHVGDYDVATQYYQNNIITFNGCSYMAKQNTLGNQPPLLPLTQDDNWTLIAIKGNDGASLTYKGVYDNATQYSKDDLIYYTNGIVSAVYSATQTTIGNLPTDTIYWSSFLTGGGNMRTEIYDTSNTGVVDDSQKLGGQLPAYYTKESDFVAHQADYASLLINVKYPPTGYAAAKVDGLTDDTAATNAIISYISTNGGGTCYIPEGTLIATSIIQKSNVVIKGAGKNVTIVKEKDEGNGNLFTSASIDISFYGICDLTVDGNYVSQTSMGTGIVQKGSDCFILNVEVKNCRAYGIQCFGGVRQRIENCYVHHNKNVGIFVGNAGFTIEDVNISKCDVSYNNSHGILIGNTATTIAKGIIITENTCHHNGETVADEGGGGIWVYIGASNVNISNNTCEYNNGDNIGICGGRYCAIVGNVCRDAIGPTWDHANSGIAISAGSTHVTALGNQCFNNTAAGIIIRGTCNNITVANNSCWNNSQNIAGDFSGIQISTIAPDTDSGNYIIVESNRCLDEQGTKTQGYGIKIDANADYVICRNNIVTPNLTGAIQNNALSSKSVRISDNLGYNPVANLTPPELIHGAGIYNTFCFPVRIFLTGGTISAVYVAGVLTGTTGGMYILQPNEGIQVNFTGTPAWKWIGM